MGKRSRLSTLIESIVKLHRRQVKPMPRYAIVVIVEAPQSETAWEKVKQPLLEGAVRNAVSYVGAPWIVPCDRHRPVEYETDSIRLRLDGECVNLDPAG
jgi:hypothetical protein